MKTIPHQARYLLAAIIAGTLVAATLAPVAAEQSSLAALRNATAPFHDFDKAQAGGYTVEVADLAGITCIEDPEGNGTMGIHYLNPSLFDSEIGATTPELLIFEPQRNGKLKLIAVEYLVLKDDWDAVNPSPPVLFGEEFHEILAGNRYGLPAFYELHAWIWKPNRSGMFYEWNPRVIC